MFLFRKSNLLAIAILLTVAACGGSGTDTGTTSFTVSAVAGLNGTISPNSLSVDENTTASFTVTPNAGFEIDSVSGCGGSLNGNIYTTAAITADCTVSASFVLQRVTLMLGEVKPLFTNAAKWNDYVPGDDWSTASNIACNAASDTACLHGGEYQVVVVTGKTDCVGLTATDDLGAFNWVCEDSTGTAQMISTGLADDKHLSHLINFAAEAFELNAVTVSDAIGVWGVTPGSTWWSNDIQVNNTGGSLASESTIYLVTSDPATGWSLFAEKVALVVQSGVTLTGSAGDLVRLLNFDYLWFEGSIDASGSARGVSLYGTRFSVLRNVVAENAFVNGVYLESSPYNMLSYVTASNSGEDGIQLVTNSDNNLLSNVTAASNSSSGINILGTSNNILAGVTASNNASGGVELNNATFNTLSGVAAKNNVFGILFDTASNNNTLSDVTASNNTNTGVILIVSSNNSLSGLTLGNNDYGASITNSSNNTLSGMTASNNSVMGVDLYNASNNRLSGLTVNSNSIGARFFNASNNTLSGLSAVNNGNDGVLLTDTSTNNTLSGLAASNSTSGVRIYSSSDDNRFSDLAASNNDYGFSVYFISTIEFTGWLEVGNNTDDCDVRFDAGLDTDCVSDATLVSNINLANSFVGKVLIDDTRNADDTDGGELVFPDPAAFDWTSFDNAFRGWGIDGPLFPATNQRGQWSSGGGRIWDWSLSIGDNGNSGGPALLGILTLPDGNNTVTHAWNGTPGTPNTPGCEAMVAGSVWNGTDSVCETSYLRNSVEIQDDGIGNDNTLCESSEACLYTPNIGSYQGHGNLVSAGAFNNGSLTGITLLQYATNGR